MQPISISQDCAAALLHYRNGNLTQVGRRLSRSLARSRHPRLADLTFAQLPRLPSETDEQVMQDLVFVLQRMPWATQEIAAAVLLRIFRRGGRLRFRAAGPDHLLSEETKWFGMLQVLSIAWQAEAHRREHAARVRAEATTGGAL